MPALSAVLLLCACSGPQYGTAPAFPTPVPTPTPVSTAPVEIDPLVREYIERVKVDTTVTELVATAMKPYQEQLPDVPEDFWSDFAATVDSSVVYLSYAELIDEFYTREELEAIVGFLRTEPGAKLVRGLRDVDEQQVARSAAWVRKVRKDLAHQLRLKRYLYP